MTSVDQNSNGVCEINWTLVTPVVFLLIFILTRKMDDPVKVSAM